MRGDELSVWRAGYPSDQLGVHSCFVVEQREVRSGETLSVLFAFEMQPERVIWFEMCKFDCHAVLSHSGTLHKQRSGPDCFHAAQQVEEDCSGFCNRESLV